MNFFRTILPKPPIAFSYFLFLISLNSFSQDLNPSSRPAAHTIYAELGGPVVSLLGINYEYSILSKERYKLNARIGFPLHGSDYSLITQKEFSWITGLNINLGKYGNFGNVGVGHLFSQNEYWVTGSTTAKEHHHYGFAQIGFRRQKPAGGFFFSSSFYAAFPLTKASLSPSLYGGIGMGYTLKSKYEPKDKWDISHKAERRTSLGISVRPMLVGLYEGKKNQSGSPSHSLTYSFDPTANFGISMGPVLDYSNGKRFLFRTEFHFQYLLSTLKYTYSISGLTGSNTTVGRFSTQTWNIQTPFHFGAFLGKEKNIGVYAGPYFQFGLKGRVEGCSTENGTTTCVDLPLFSTEVTSVGHLGVKARGGLGISGGVTLQKTMWKIPLELDIRMGKLITSLSPRQDVEQWWLGAGLGVFLPSRKEE